MTARPQPPEGFDENPPLDAEFFARARPAAPGLLPHLSKEPEMQADALSAEFGKRYHAAVDGMTVVTIHLFGIEFAKELEGHNLKDICVGAGESHLELTRRPLALLRRSKPLSGAREAVSFALRSSLRCSGIQTR
jgi:hypothetical protein